MENLDKRINEKLKSINEDPEAIKPFMMEHLRNIENYMSNIENDFNMAIEALKLKDCTVSAVAKELSMSRTTLYNHNHLLKRYIEATQAYLLESSPTYQSDKIKAEIANMKTKINMLYDRDITLEIQKHEISELSNHLIGKSIEINRLETRNRELSSELHALKTENKSISTLTKINR